MDTVLTLVPLLLVDVLNPVLFAALIYTAGSGRPVANASALLAGHTTAYLTLGVVASFGVETLTARLAEPQPIDFLIEFVMAIACLYAAFASRGGGASEERHPEGDLVPLKCFGFGAIINFIGAPFALPYLAVLDQLLQAGLSMPAFYASLLGYNLAYALPFVTVPLLVAVMGDRARPLLETMNGFLTRVADLLMPWLMLLLGLFLLADTASYLLTGEPLPIGS